MYRHVNVRTKGITLYKNLKTKTIYVHSALIMKNKDEAKVYTDQETYDLKTTDFNYATLESRFSSFIKLEKGRTLFNVI